MTLEKALNMWLTELTGLDCFWLKRPEDRDLAVVYRCLSPGYIAGNLASGRIREDSYSITVYHHDPDLGKTMAEKIEEGLHEFSGQLNADSDNAYLIQLATLSGGFDQWMGEANGRASYQFNRDFLINH